MKQKMVIEVAVYADCPRSILPDDFPFAMLVAARRVLKANSARPLDGLARCRVVGSGREAVESADWEGDEDEA